MYAVALSVVACVRAGTRVDVAWIVDGDLPGDRDPADALAITPGGGRVGSVVSGAVDGQLVDQASRGSHGRLADIVVSDVDALVAGLPGGGRRPLPRRACRRPAARAVGPADRPPAGLSRDARPATAR